jgi:hypothetical protein
MTNPTRYYDNFIRDNFVRGKEKKVGQFWKPIIVLYFFFPFFLGPSSFWACVGPATSDSL